MAGCFGGSPAAIASTGIAGFGTRAFTSSSQMNRELSRVYGECQSKTASSSSPLATPINSHSCNSLTQWQKLPELRFRPRPSVYLKMKNAALRNGG